MPRGRTQGGGGRTAQRYEPAVRRPRSALTRERLLRAALAIFRERGYHGTGTNDIGAAAGLTGPSIYRHFASKDDLLVAAVLEGARRLGDGAIAVRSESDPFTALEALCRSFVEVAVDDPDLCCVYFFESRHVPVAARTRMDVSARRYLDTYAQLVSRVLPDLAADEVSARVQGAVLMIGGICIDLPDIPTERLVSMVTDRMLTVLVAPPLSGSDASVGVGELIDGASPDA
jgi:AcrR family transcriptional regulator